MKTILLTLIGVCAFCLNVTIHAQCNFTQLIDSSFESGNPITGAGNPIIGEWYPIDGVSVTSADAHTGNYSAQCVGGGAIQPLILDANTVYYASCYVKKNYANDFFQFLINDIYYPHENLNTTGWTFVSKSFNTNSDTLAEVGFYGGSANVDEFRITCSPPVSIHQIKTELKPYNLSIFLSNQTYVLTLYEKCTLDFFSLDGRFCKTATLNIGLHEIGKDLNSSIYFVRISTQKGLWTEKILIH